MFRPMDSEIRIAMLQAVEERQELGHELLGADHLLLGLLSNVRGSVYPVFAEHGVTYDWARKVVEEKHDDEKDDEPRDGAAESANNLDEDREALRAIGIDLDAVRDAVRETFGEDITERWGQRRQRGEGGRRGPRGHGPHDHPHGPHGHGPHGGGPHDGPRDEREADDGRHGPDFASFADVFAEFGPGAFGPRGRGRRGPRSRRFDRITPSLRSVRRQMHDDLLRRLHDNLHSDAQGRRSGGVSAASIAAAILDSGDAAVDAIVEAADDPKALRAAIDELAGRATA